MSDREDAVGSGGMLIILVHEFLAGMFVAINCVLKYHPILRRRLSLFFLIALFVLNAAFSQPKIVVVEGTQFDFGKIDQGETITKKLTLKNTGNDTLRISNVSTSCGCTVARLSTKLLVPGDSALLTIAFYTKDVVGSRVKRQVFVRSNDSTESSVTITMVADIRSVIEAEPRYINFGVVERGSKVTRTVVLRNRLDTAVKLLSVSVPDSQLTARLSGSVVNPSGKTELVVSLIPEKRGKLAGRIEIATDSQRQPKVSISYIAGVKK